MSDDTLLELRRPFTVEALQFKIQSDKGTNCLIVGYIDARQAAERLNLVVPGEWGTEYRHLDSGDATLLTVECQLTVEECVRADVGVASVSQNQQQRLNDHKTVYSDAFKRAAVHFGVNVPTYYMPQIWIPKSEMDKRGEKVYLSNSARNQCRQRYGAWLESEGTARFGQPLDMGDSVDAQGDYEVEEVAPTGQEAEEASPNGPPEALKKQMKSAYKVLAEAKGKDEAEKLVRLKLTAMGVSGQDDMNKDEAESFLMFLVEGAANA